MKLYRLYVDDIVGETLSMYSTDLARLVDWWVANIFSRHQIAYKTDYIALTKDNIISRLGESVDELEVRALLTGNATVLFYCEKQVICECMFEQIKESRILTDN